MEAVYKVAEILAFCRSAQLSHWSVRTAERSLGWARLAEASGCLDPDTLQAVVHEVRRTQHVKGELGPSVQDPVALCKQPQVLLLSALTDSPFPSLAVRKWALSHLGAESDSSETCTSDKDNATGVEQRQWLVENMTRELQEWPSYREGLGLRYKKTGTVQETGLLLDIVLACCTSAALQETARWIVKLLEARCDLLSQSNRKTCLALAKKRLDFAGVYLSLLIVEIDKSPERNTDNLEEFCKEAGWLRSFCLSACRDSPSIVGKLMHQVATKP